VRDGDVLRPTNFTNLCFDLAEYRHMKLARTRFTVYRGTEPDDAPVFEEHGFAWLPQAVRALLEHLLVHATTLPDEREGGEVERYPYSALREAIVNAAVHRDWSIEAPLCVTVFADRVEVRSPGGLLPGTDPASLDRGTAPPRRRNPCVAWLLGGLRLTAPEGEGLRTILADASRLGAPRPTFEVGPDHVTCTVYEHRRSRLHVELDDIERRLAAGDVAGAWAAVEPLAAALPDNPAALSMSLRVARSAGHLDAIAEALFDRHYDFRRLDPRAHVAMVEDAADRHGVHAFWPMHSEWALDLVRHARLPEADRARLAIALARAGQLDDMHEVAVACVGRYHPPPPHLLPMLLAVARAWSAHVARVRAYVAAHPPRRRDPKDQGDLRRALEMIERAEECAREAGDEAAAAEMAAARAALEER
jgi:hypothetical protein